MKRIIAVINVIMILFLCTSCGNKIEQTENVMQADKSAKTQRIKERENNDMQMLESEESKKEKILIAYFSLTEIVPEGADASAHATPSIGNTEAAALEIQKQTGGELFAIKTEKAYPVSHRECSKEAEEEMRSDARPKLSGHVERMEDYDTVYIGYPIWWYQEPMAIRTFLEEYDFSGKTLIPFCTSLGAGIGESEESIQKLCPNASILHGLTLYTGQDSFSESIAEWLEELGKDSRI